MLMKNAMATVASATMVVVVAATWWWSSDNSDGRGSGTAVTGWQRQLCDGDDGGC